jgi:hypothetical protein
MANAEMAPTPQGTRLSSEQFEKAVLEFQSNKNETRAAELWGIIENHLFHSVVR